MTTIGHDVATCPECLAEMFDPANRRFRHAFITCTHCGPRYTVTRALPYDRAQTSLAPFPLCSRCAREYADPADRRFHAETTCCPECGPQLQLCDASGAIMTGDAVAAALQLLQSGAIIAIKGLGGFHLACNAQNATAVAKLRARKMREEKPFAVMTADVASLARFTLPDAADIALLVSRERPVVLVRKRPQADTALPGVSPGLAFLGVMLPYTPLQHLFFHDAPDLVLVMTSANPGGEPLVIGNEEARQRLAGIADAILVHGREILIRCDDSVARATSVGTQFIRRARGYTPRPIKLAQPGPSVLALGGWFKNTITVTRGAEAFVSQHIGDLDNAATIGFLEETIAHLIHILEVEPALIAHDLHPDFASTRLALQLAAERDIPALAVQHHHAHIAAVLAEHGHNAPALGLALDGIGLGSDGKAWGGELLRVDAVAMTRLGHLAEISLPGGDRAAREPWRMGAAVLHQLGRADEITTRCSTQAGAAAVRQMLALGTHCPMTSSCGRWFDAASGLLGLQPTMSFEGQAAMLLEGLAETCGAVAPLTAGWTIAAGELSLLPLMQALADNKDAARGAALFHATLAAALAEWVLQAVEREKIRTVALGGGCFLNRLLATQLEQYLTQAGLQVLSACQVPPNDGGISLGQAWCALQSTREQEA
jgi:hydrogenase maturation protein HypF